MVGKKRKFDEKILTLTFYKTKLILVCYLVN